MNHGHLCGRIGQTVFVYCTLATFLFPLNALAGFCEHHSTDDKRDPKSAIAGLDVAKGLDVTLAASEPELLSLTNLDIDHRGRIWLCEVVNYRRHNGKRAKGDRILICEDRNQDGVMDDIKVYYQGRDVDSAMGICVLGNRVIVSASPNVLVFTDTDGDDKPDKKEILFSNTGIAQHDHSAHSFVFGPDGKLYWNFGNTGRHVHDKDGRIVKDLRGLEVRDNGKPYFGGMVFRCNLDGSQLEVLGHNFRNNYEVAVDSFGELWQSDNDDDGNRGVRINFVMEYGNYGYRDEINGAGWNSKRTGMHPEIPKRHWHLNDPGVVPNLLQTGAGSPTGITIYEGDLLPEEFHNTMIHCDAGPNIVRAYPTTVSGAGYSASMNNILHGARDKWFRPADVAVAPDGSLFVTDWYDPGVGGHGMGDLKRGRLFRIAPPDSTYKIPTYNYSSPFDMCQALMSPNASMRFEGWMELRKMGTHAEPQLNRFYKNGNPRQAARALWLLAELEGQRRKYVELGLRHTSADIRCTAIRIARNDKTLFMEIAKRMVSDPSAKVRRALLIGLRNIRTAEATETVLQLMEHYDGKDRWYLEAIGIAADGRWDELFSSWPIQLDDFGNSSILPQLNHLAKQELVWRSRGERSSDYLKQLLMKKDIAEAQAMRFFRAFDFQDRKFIQAPLRELLMFYETKRSSEASVDQHLIAKFFIECAKRLNDPVTMSEPMKQTIIAYLKQIRGSEEYIDHVLRFKLAELTDELVDLAIRSDQHNLVGRATRAIYQLGQQSRLIKKLSGEELQQIAVVNALKFGDTIATKESLSKLLFDEKLSINVRTQVIRSLGRRIDGQQILMQLVKDSDRPDSFNYPLADVLLNSRKKEIREAAAKYLSLPTSAEKKPLPALDQLVRKRGDRVRGKKVYFKEGTCFKCHQVAGEGSVVGPDLSEIGNKLSKQGMYESILNPNAAISHNYESYTIMTLDGRTHIGVLVSKTDELVTIKDKDAALLEIKVDDIDEMSKSTKSLMPDDVHQSLTEQQLVDLVEYLMSLKK